MIPRILSASLTPVLAAILCAAVLCAAVPGQQCRWSMEKYATAIYERKVELRARALEPADFAPKPASVQTTNQIKNPSFETIARKVPRFWAKYHYVGAAKLQIDEKTKRTGKVSVTILAKHRADTAWRVRVAVKPDTRYRLSGYIKTKDIDRGAGAALQVETLGKSATTPEIRGTTDWKKVQIEFRTAIGQKAVYIHCMLGGYQPAIGQAWFDDLELVEVAETRVLDEVLRDALFRAPRSAALLHFDELDKGRQFVARPPRDLRDLARYLALDLRRAKLAVSVRAQTLEVPEYERLIYTANYGEVSAEGMQTIKVKLRTKAPKSRKRGKAPDRAKKGKDKKSKDKKGKGEKGVGARRARTDPLANLTGELTIRRHMNPARDCVIGFTSKLSLIVARPTGLKGLAEVRKLSFELGETWRYKRLARAEDSVFRGRVHHAIHTGTRYLRGWASKAKMSPGRLGLVILTLIKGGESHTDPLLKKLLDRLRKAKIVRTYDLATAIMAIESIYSPPGERDAIIQGRLDAPILRRPSAADRALLEKWVAVLLKNIDSRVQSAYTLRFSYTPARRYDNSNTQYAMLGLYTASLCGVKISPQVWIASANHWLAVQAQASGQEIPLTLPSNRFEKKSKQGKSRRTVARFLVKPRGWTYTGPNKRATSGSMTAAGITGLAVCEAALTTAKNGNTALKNRMRKAIRGGFAWLADNFAVDRNPKRPTHWHYYYLYGLERACEINGVARLNDLHWYFEGASLILEQQKATGGWTNPTDSCFAILFLKKAAPPAITGSR